MLPTSQAYKDLVYSTTIARYFVPQVLIKALNTNVRALSSYFASSLSYLTDLSQLTNDVFKTTRNYGTLEDMFFKLDGTKYLLDETDNGELGFISESLCNENGVFTTPVELVCTYPSLVTTTGRTVYFDSGADAVPRFFSFIYYDASNVILKKIDVSNNTEYIYTDKTHVANYKRMVFKVAAMTKPYRRVRILEDVPGVYLRYDDKQVISMSFNQSVDILSNEIVTGQLNVMVENTAKQIDILNTKGIEKALSYNQSMEVYMNMIFPDNTVEEILIGRLALNTWKTSNNTLSASFTARDIMETLSLNEYYKDIRLATRITSMVETGWHWDEIEEIIVAEFSPSYSFEFVPKTLYALAEEVLTDAGIADYTIDASLQEITTTGIIPIVTHKEALRLIAQAGQCVVLPRADNSIHIKKIATTTALDTAVDSLDYSVLFEAPDVDAAGKVKEVVTKIVVPSASWASSGNVYDDVSLVTGTEDVVVKFSNSVLPTFLCTNFQANGMDKYVKITNGTLDAANSILYNSGAKLRITAIGTGAVEVGIAITGFTLNTDTSKSVTVACGAVAANSYGATTKTIDNRLVNTHANALAVATYGAYWYDRGYVYNLSWRQNPAVENLDVITIHDDFDVDNNVLFVERTIDYTGGVLSGSSKGIS